MLILDEPTAGLDPEQVADMRALIRDLRADRTVILSTHILPEVEATCDRVIIIHRGRVAGARHARQPQPPRAPHGAGRRRGQRPAAPTCVATLRAVPGVLAVDVAAGTTARCMPWSAPTSTATCARTSRPASSSHAAGACASCARETLTLEEIFLALVADGADPSEHMKLLVICRRELSAYFGSIVAYVLLAVFLVLSGYFFYSDLVFFVLFGGFTLPTGLWQFVFLDMRLVAMLILPLVTMRLFAEEKKLGTLELLWTYPVRDGEIVARQVPRRAALLPRHAARRRRPGRSSSTTTTRSTSRRCWPAISACCCSAPPSSPAACSSRR